MKQFTQSITLASVALACALGSVSSIAAPAQADLVPLVKNFANSGKVMVKNIGKAKSRASWLTIQCLANACPEHPSMKAYANPKFPDTVTLKIPGLKPGGNFSHQLSFWKHLEFEPGQYKFLFIADAGKDIPESNELNNKKVVVKKVKKPVNSFAAKSSTKPAKPKINKKSAKGIQYQVGNQASSQLTTGLGKPDLAISPYYNNSANLPEGFPTHSYCKKNPAGGAATRLVFYIENEGTVLAQASQVQILFNTFMNDGGASSTHTTNVTPISAGSKKYMSIPIPANCYKPGFNQQCHFRIVADSAYQIPESNNVTNNYVDSFCVSPAG